MTGFLLDTNVISDTARLDPNPAVTAWLEQRAGQLFIPTMAIAEIKLGIELLPDGRRRRAFESWFTGIVQDGFAQSILAFDTEAALTFGRMTALARRAGRPAHVVDAQIAAVAAVHGLTVATRDIADFAGFGVALVNPFEGP